MLLTVKYPFTAPGLFKPTQTRGDSLLFDASADGTQHGKMYLINKVAHK